MTREALREASEVLTEAASGVGGEAGDRLAAQAEQLADLAERERDPDHGRLDRHQQVLRDVRESVDDEVAGRIDDAIGLVSDYRETLPGV